MDTLKRYQQLTLEMSFAKKTIRQIEFYIKNTPPRCPLRKQLYHNLGLATQLKRDIASDINHLADTIDYKLSWPVRR
jgi:hypothetical protein